MSKIVFISCVSKKKDVASRAEDLYDSALYNYSLSYAKKLKPDRIFILSALYGLVKLDEVIEPYDLTLNDMKTSDKKAWSKKVIAQMDGEGLDFNKDEFVFLAGNNYRQYLVEHLTNVDVPLEGLTIGKQLQYLKKAVSIKTFCDQLHWLVNDMKRITFPFDENLIPKNGIYIIFEKGEKAHEKERIVRIGTHTGNDQLRSRLKQHFLQENKDRSIFRKNIGRCLLHKDGHSYAEKWELDLTTRKNKEQYGDVIDSEFQLKMESEISQVIQKNFSFVVIEVGEKEERLLLESRLISEVSNCPDCGGSDSWLGNHSPKEKIRKSSLWQVNELYKEGFSDEEFIEFQERIRDGNQ